MSGICSAHQDHDPSCSRCNYDAFSQMDDLLMANGGEPISRDGVDPGDKSSPSGPPASEPSVSYEKVPTGQGSSDRLRMLAKAMVMHDAQARLEAFLDTHRVERWQGRHV